MAFTTIVTGTTITSSWANADVRDQVITPFASAAARDSAITSPVTGQCCALTTNLSTEGIYQYNSAGVWRIPWNIPWGYVTSVEKTSSQTGISTLTDITSLTTGALTAVGNRRWMVEIELRGTQSTLASAPEVYLTDGSDVVKVRRAITAGVNEVGLWRFGTVVTTTAGSVTYKGRATTGGGTFTVDCSAEYPARISVFDVGPAGAPA